MASRNAIFLTLIQELSDDTDMHIDDMTVQVVGESAHLVAGAAAVLAEDDSNDNPVRMQGYAEEVVLMYSPREFHSHFRMHRDTFEDLCCEWAPYLPKERSLSIEKRLMCTLWLVANKESYRSVADRFGISKGTLHLTVITSCRALTSQAANYIKFPANRMEMQKIASGYLDKTKFPGVVGAIDGTHIEIPAPKSDHRASFINRKGFASIQLQVVCDSDLRFLDTYTGWPGSVHDARVYRNSPVKDFICGLPDDYHVLGDSAYPLSTNLVVPYRDNGHLEHWQKNFNKVHSSTRVDVERSIGRLKCKFRRLLFLDMIKQTEIPDVITACCVLHNFIIDREDEEMEDLDLEENYDAPENENAVVCAPAEEKRRQIAHML